MNTSKKNFLFLCFLLIITFQVRGQGNGVFNANDDSYLFPWAGGMNSVQFGELDINLDGIKDIVAFDRQGNRIMPFINEGIINQIKYNYAPEYTGLFPELYDWAIFVDYNNDGKSDIFTYSPGWAGMIVYKNVSVDNLKFKKVVYPYLTSLNNGGEVNILVTYADYPGIADLDNDGDLDILTFWGLGSFVEMHKNLSMETYGNADSLIFEKTEECWGHFAESDESNELFLDTCFSGTLNPEGIPFKRPERHTGSTFLLLDLDADNDKDLLLGDVDYPGLFALTNGGTAEEAQITAIDTLFPNAVEKIRLYSMPAAAYMDVNNDGKNDLIVAPFDPAPVISKNYDNIELFLNNGQNNNPEFHRYYYSFLQPDMIDVGSGAVPVFFDWDDDGLTDLFIGNYGYYNGSWYDEYFTLHSDYKAAVAWYKNFGTPEKPQFGLYDVDFGGFLMDDEVYTGVVPAFGDIDNDEKNEMIIGNSDGTLILYEITEEVVKTPNYFNIDVGDFSAPLLFDLDKDGLLDLIVGEQNGNLNYYHNNGTASEPDFELVTDSLGKINVTDYNVSWYGYSTPWFYRTAEGVTKLIVGSEQGKLFYFENIDNNLTGAFTESDKLYELIGVNEFNTDRGMRTAGTLSDIDSDGKPELIVGNFSGGVELFGADAKVYMPVQEKPAEKIAGLTLSPNPADSKTTLVFPENITGCIITMYDLSGKAVLTKSVNTGLLKSIDLDVSGYPAGFYTIFLTGNNRRYMGKLIIVK